MDRKKVSVWATPLLLIICLSLCGFSAAPSTSTPAVVSKFYETLKRLSATTNESAAYDMREQLSGCFRGKEDSGIYTPNDFADWGYKDYTKLTANLYVKYFYELAFQKKVLRVDNYKVEDSHYLSEADLKEFKNQSNNKYIQSVITKTFAGNSITKAFTDTLLIEQNEIVVFKNAIYEKDEVDVGVLRALAASHYTDKRYVAAYRTYEKIISIDPYDSNAYYRLGIMTYYGEGCRRSKSLAIDYMTRADNLGAKNADRVLTRMKYANR